MKKKLEAELMSIAHNILRIKDRSDVEVLLQETQKLYQKLSVLKFVEENFSHLQPTIGKIEIEREMEAAFDAQDRKAQDTDKEEAFAERTQQNENLIEDEGDSQDISADSAVEKDDDSIKDESFEEENDVEETEDENESENDQDSEEEVEQEVSETEEEVAAVIEQGNVVSGTEEEGEENDLEEELDLEENSEEDSEAVVEENDDDDDDKDEDEDEDEDDDEDGDDDDKTLVLETPAAQETTEEVEEELEMPEAFSSEESQVKTLEIGTAEAIANDEVLQDKPEDEKFDPSEKLFKPAFDWDFVAKEDDKPAVEQENEAKVEEVEKPVAPATRQFTFDDLLGSSYKDPVFVTPADLERERLQAEEKMMSDAPIIKEEPIVIPTPKAYETPRPLSINDKLSKGIIVGLNDRIAFVKHLFGNSNEDYNRVLSQMLTFNTMEEAKEFIDEMVKPDYKNWEGKEDYEERFLEVISKKFS